MKIACIGARNLNDSEREICRVLGRWIVRRGGIITSGNADGADRAFAAGGNEVDPMKVHLFLPWQSFNAAHVVKGNVVTSLDSLRHDTAEFYWKLAADNCPHWENCTHGHRKMHTRNGCIVLPPFRPISTQPLAFKSVDLCIAFPGVKTGGTGQGMRVCEELTIPLVNIRGFTHQQLNALCQRIRELG